MAEGSGDLAAIQDNLLRIEVSPQTGAFSVVDKAASEEWTTDARSFLMSRGASCPAS